MTRDIALHQMMLLHNELTRLEELEDYAYVSDDIMDRRIIHLNSRIVYLMNHFAITTRDYFEYVALVNHKIYTFN